MVFIFKGSWLHGSQGKGSPASYSAATVEQALDSFEEESLAARAVQAGVGGCAIGLIFSLPTWIRARTWRPPRSVIREVFEFGALSAASEVVEASVERLRGRRKDDLVAPIVAIVVPRVVSVTLFALLSNKRYKDDVRSGRVSETRCSQEQDAATKEAAAREAAALDEWYPSEQFRWRAYGRNLLSTVALPVLNTVTFHVLSNQLAVARTAPKKIAPRWL